MNQKIFKRELKRKGINVNNIAITENGYKISVTLCPELNKGGFEEFEKAYYDGLEILCSKRVDGYDRTYIFVPTNEKEFRYYVNWYIKEFNTSKYLAVADLALAIKRLKNPDVETAFRKYADSLNK